MSDLLLWPPGEDPPSSIPTMDFTKHVGTLPKGVSRVDFTSGQLHLPGGRTERISQSLSDVDADFVRSVHIHSDNHLLWWASDQESGQYMEQMRKHQIRDTELRSLTVFAFAPTQARFLASTSPELGVEPTGLERAFVRGTYDANNDDANVTVNDTFETLEWTTEYDLERPNPSPNPDLHIMNVGDFSLQVTNNGADPVELAAVVKNPILDNMTLDAAVGFAELSGWTEAAPKSVAAGASETFELTLPYHFIQFKARCGTAGATTDVAAAFFARTV